MKEKVIEIMKTIFECENIDKDSNPNTIDSWDSLNHVKMIAVLEEEFDVEFDHDEIIEMLSLEKILNVLAGK